jgi:hypothetical protein
MNNSSFMVHFARRSGSAQRNTVTGLATSMNTAK